MQKSKRKRILQHFGIEDSIVNTTALLHDSQFEDDEDGGFRFCENGMKGLNKRFFTVQSVTNTESLIFPFSEIDNFKKDFKISSMEFFKEQMRQT